MPAGAPGARRRECAEPRSDARTSMPARRAVPTRRSWRSSLAVSARESDEAAVRRIVAALPPAPWQRRRAATWLPLAAGVGLVGTGFALLGGVPGAERHGRVAGGRRGLPGLVGFVGSRCGGSGPGQLRRGAGDPRGRGSVARAVGRCDGSRRRVGVAGAGPTGGRRSRVIALLLAGVLAGAPAPRLGADVLVDVPTARHGRQPGRPGAGGVRGRRRRGRRGWRRRAAPGRRGARRRHRPGRRRRGSGCGVGPNGGVRAAGMGRLACPPRVQRRGGSRSSGSAAGWCWVAC